MDKRATLQALLTAFAAKEGMPKRKAELFVRTFFDVIQEALVQDKFVKIKGFGTFKLVAVGDRESVDVNTGERIQITGHAKVTFIPDNSLKDLINRPFSHFQTVVINEGTDIAALEAITDETGTPEDDTATDTTETPQDADNEETADAPLVPDTDSDFDEEETDAPDDNEQPDDVSQPADGITEDEEPSAPQEPATIEMVSTDDIPDYRVPAASEADDETTDTDEPQESPEPPAEPPHTDVEYTDEEQDEGTPQDETDTPIEEMSREDERGATAPLTPAEEEETEHAAATPQEEDASPNDEPQVHAEEDSTERTPHHEKQIPTGMNFPPPPARETNWWKITVGIIFVLFLMMLSYFAGYFRLFCPCEQLESWHRQFIGQPAPEQGQNNSAQPTPAPPPQPMPVQPAADSLTTQPSPSAAEAAKDTVAAPAQPEPAAKTVQQPAKETAPASSASTPPKQDAPRTANSKQRYIIVGTRRTYVVSRGETLRTIAEREYGSKGYAPYIIQHNQLTNPDEIPVGMTLKLPELKRNPDYRP